jgi:hypothetical protein
VAAVEVGGVVRGACGQGRNRCGSRGVSLAVVAESEIVSMLEEVADTGVGKLDTRVIVIQGTEGVALPVGTKSSFREKTCPCVVGRCFCNELL